MTRLTALIFFVLQAGLSQAQETQTQYLSGTGNDHTVNWQFYCTAGRQSGKWTTIPVPSNWELQGFGKYNYGLDKDSVKGREEGLYKYTFRVPSGWKDRTVNIVFDGSMTDTRVKVNGRSAGVIHQGAFYRFTYDITRLLYYGKDNLLEVTVDKESANRSVNMAERHGDFWVFGGIFRPVYLQAFPREHISHVAVDAEADGKLKADLQLQGIRETNDIQGQVYTMDGLAAGQPFSVKVGAGSRDGFGARDGSGSGDKAGLVTPDTLAHLETTLDHPLLWTPETPNLYKVVFTLSGKDGAVHRVTQRFGFRTVELRERDGIYVNGVKVKFKGVCRHSFWPSSGRTTSMALSIVDVGLMKDMNMNAVRMSHYPPDDHFLDVCDSMGLFVLDELTGWHHAYDTQVGSRLVKEMIEKDVNHPSIVIWDNGNEGGFNFDLDPLFDRLDIQHRPLIHPWAVFRHTDTQHYINYDYGNGAGLQGHEVTFPTEFLHGLYDGGGGAGLEDYWEAMWGNPLSAGGFIWDFSDEAVVRTDREGELDTDGDHAPDGILGPYREKEGSYFAIKEIWAPIHITHREITKAFDGRLTLGNRFTYTNMKDCRFTWKLLATAGPYTAAQTGDTLTGDTLTGIAQSPDIAPGAEGILSLSLPADWQNYDVLYLTAKDPHGREIYTWSWPISLPERTAGKILGATGVATGPTLAEGPIINPPGAARVIRLDSTDTAYKISVKGLTLSFNRKNGRLMEARNEKGLIPLSNGPILSDGTESFSGITARYQDSNLVLQADYARGSDLQGLTWTVYPSGWLRMDVQYFPSAYNTDLIGVDFSYPESAVKAVRWMGDGPYRVYKDRMKGVTLGVWDKNYNNTITGQGIVVYPEFKGYYSNLHWVRLLTSGQPLTIVCASEDIFLRLFTPAPPAHPYNTVPAYPAGDISFMHGIPPVGTKSQKAETMGPMGQKNMYYDYGKARSYAKKLTLYMDFSGN
jgi:hypothetical protein